MTLPTGTYMTCASCNKVIEWQDTNPMIEETVQITTADGFMYSTVPHGIACIKPSADYVGYADKVGKFTVVDGRNSPPPEADPAP